MEGICVIGLSRHYNTGHVRRGFTLMESLMASAMLFAGVLAVITAIMGGQKRAFEAQRRMEAALVAEELMGDIATMDYAALASIPTIQPIGSFQALTTRTIVDEDLTGMGVRIHGSQMHVAIAASMSELASPLAEFDFYIPEPQS